MSYPSRSQRGQTLTRCRRISVAGIVGFSSWVATAEPVRADHQDETKFEFEALAANATLTDCPTSGPAGLRCTGVVVRTSTTKGDFPTTDQILVELYDVELTEGSFVATLIGSGVGDPDHLSIKSNLKRASVSATVDITSCTFDPSLPEPTCELVRTLELAVTWVGTGAVTKSHFEDSFEADGCTHEFESDIRDRAATVTATVDGNAMPNSALPQFAPSLSSYKSEQEVKCKGHSAP